MIWRGWLLCSHWAPVTRPRTPGLSRAMSPPTSTHPTPRPLVRASTTVQHLITITDHTIYNYYSNTGTNTFLLFIILNIQGYEKLIKPLHVLLKVNHFTTFMNKNNPNKLINDVDASQRYSIRRIDCALNVEHFSVQFSQIIFVHRKVKNSLFGNH